MEDRQPLLKEALEVDEDQVWFGPSAALANDISPDLMVYFIPGNPCTVSYYKLFLSHLSTLLNPGIKNGKHRQPAVVGGSTLPGFQLSRPSIIKGTLPAGLQDEIVNAEMLLARAVARHSPSGVDGASTKGPKVILMAHSVGAYMVLEILRRRAQSQTGLADTNVIGAVLLFPTVTEIAQSWHGSILSIFLCIPYFPALVAAFSKIATLFLSVSMISWIICFFGRIPAHIGKATAEFLKSPMGVYQALHLTIDEMKMIKHDSWDEVVWGSSAAEAEKTVPLRFYFGAEDVWVSNKARDRLIASRASSGQGSDSRDIGKPVMVIDNEGIPHAFIIDHSQKVAEKAESMIEELMRLNSSKT